MITKTSKGNYCARIFYKENGKRKSVSKTFPVKPAAVKYEAEMILKKATGDPIVRKELLLTDYFIEWFHTFKEPTVSPATAKRYTETYRVLISKLGDVSLNDMTRKKYQEFINDYGSNHAKETVSKVHSQTRAAVTDAFADGIIDRDFTANISLIGNAGKSETEKFLNLADMQKLSEYVSKDIMLSAISPAMIYVALETGLRLSELAALQESNIYPEFNRIRVENSWNYLASTHYINEGNHESIDFKPTKNKSSIRTVDVTENCMNFIVKLIDMQHRMNKSSNPYHLIFLTNRGEIPTSNAVNKYLSHKLIELGIQTELTFHGLRHTHASYLLAKDVKIEYVSKRLGHASIETTIRTYQHLMKETFNSESEKAVVALNNLQKVKLSNVRSISVN